MRLPILPLYYQRINLRIKEKHLILALVRWFKQSCAVNVKNRKRANVKRKIRHFQCRLDWVVLG